VEHGRTRTKKKRCGEEGKLHKDVALRSSVDVMREKNIPRVKFQTSVRICGREYTSRLRRWDKKAEI